ncbi:MAG: hypothetical protein PWR13_1221 [Archaeoglobi archaeon]|nr:hypothetical protein [Archaeoglobi archaeon]
MPRGYRWMFWLTGLPGWMRFGFSPGWGGLPPAAQYLISTGQLPQFMSFLQSYSPMGAWMREEDEIRMLRERAEALERELREIRRRIEELKRSEEE